MNIIKKITIMLVATITTCGTGVSLLANAYYGDLDWFPTSDSYVTTEASNYRPGYRNAGDTKWMSKGSQYKRHKNTDSSIYVKNNGEVGVFCKFWGLKEGSTYKYCCSSINGFETYDYNSKYVSNCWVKSNTENWIINYVNERKCQYVGITFGNTNYSKTPTGLWSPDCVGTYPVCNYSVGNIVP